MEFGSLHERGRILAMRFLQRVKRLVEFSIRMFDDKDTWKNIFTKLQMQSTFIVQLSIHQFNFFSIEIDWNDASEHLIDNVLWVKRLVWAMHSQYKNEFALIIMIANVIQLCTNICCIPKWNRLQFNVAAKYIWKILFSARLFVGAKTHKKTILQWFWFL